MKFLKQKEIREALICLIVFGAVANLLVHFLGLNLTFDKPTDTILLEEKKDFVEIKEILDMIEENYGFDRFRPFNLIPPFADQPGRSNPFIIGEIEAGTVERPEEELAEIVPIEEEIVE